MQLHSIEAAVQNPRIRQKVESKIKEFRKDRVAGDISHYLFLWSTVAIMITPALELEPRLEFLTFLFAVTFAVASELATGYYDNYAIEDLNHIETELLQLLDITHKTPLQSHDMNTLDNRVNYLEAHINKALQKLSLAK